MKRLKDFEGIVVYSSSTKSDINRNKCEILIKYCRKLNLKPQYFIISYKSVSLEVLKGRQSITVFIDGNDISRIYSTDIINEVGKLTQLSLFREEEDMKCDICGSHIDGKYAIYMTTNNEVKHVCKPCLRKIEKGIITTDMKYIRNDTYEPLVKKFRYRDLEIIGIPIDNNQGIYIDIMIDFLKDRSDRLDVSFVGNKRNSRGVIYAEVTSKRSDLTYTLFLSKQYQKCMDGSRNFTISSPSKRYLINYKDGISEVIKEEDI